MGLEDIEHDLSLPQTEEGSDAAFLTAVLDYIVELRKQMSPQPSGSMTGLEFTLRAFESAAGKRESFPSSDLLHYLQRGGILSQTDDFGRVVSAAQAVAEQLQASPHRGISGRGFDAGDWSFTQLMSGFHARSGEGRDASSITVFPQASTGRTFMEGRTPGAQDWYVGITPQFKPSS